MSPGNLFRYLLYWRPGLLARYDLWPVWPLPSLARTWHVTATHACPLVLFPRLVADPAIRVIETISVFSHGFSIVAILQVVIAAEANKLLHLVVIHSHAYWR